MPRPNAGRRGVTLIELALTMALMAILASIAIPRTAALADALRVRGAAHDLVAALGTARHAAIARGTLAAVVVTPTTGRLVVRAERDTLVRRDLAVTWGVALTATRDSVRFAPSGLGYGAANTTLVVRRGRSADTVVVSRLGRVRRQ